MKLADDIWLDSVAARNDLMAAANYSAAFYGNAAVQSWSLGLNAPQLFWSAMARAFDHDAVTSGTAPAATPVDQTPDQTPGLSVVDAAAPVEAVVEAVTAAEPEAEAEAEPAAGASNPLLLDEPRAGVADDLKRIKGIGAKLEAGLNEIGIFHFDQIAGLDAAGIDWLDEHLAGFKRSCARFDLVAGAGEFV